MNDNELQQYLDDIEAFAKEAKKQANSSPAPHTVPFEKNKKLNKTQNDKQKKKLTKKQKLKRNLIRIGVALLVLAAVYLTIVYSNIPFIKKWRTIYIETAMTTNSHQWLATLFFPQSVIDKIMAERIEGLENQIGLESSWDYVDISPEDISLMSEEEAFFTVYSELDTSSVRNYLENNPTVTANGYDNILIEDFDNKLGLKTAQGDDVLVINTSNRLIIAGIDGGSYQGKLAIIKDASLVDLGKSQALGSYGQEIDSFCEKNNAILGINASGFTDVDGVGTGGDIKGSLVLDGVDYGHPVYDKTWKLFGLKYDNRMYIADYSSDDVIGYRWAMEFFPVLILDGECIVDGTLGMGIQPRSAIGQTKSGDIMLLVIDGRQVGYSLGCTVADCADILMKYGCYQAMNLDGGSSSVMYYDGDFITSSCSVSGRGRYMPDAILVRRVNE